MHMLAIVWDGGRALPACAQDLMAVEQVPALVRAGVACFKIEGRLKGPEYVALTTRVYRDAVDAAWAAVDNPPAQPGCLAQQQTPAAVRDEQGGVGPAANGGGAAAAAAAVAPAPPALSLQRLAELQQARLVLGSIYSFQNSVVHEWQVLSRR